MAQPSTGTFSDMGNEIVHIFVGSDKKQFTIHKRLLCTHSNFFEKAFNGGFKEATEDKMDLPDDDPLIFNALVEWLYSHKRHRTIKNTSYLEGVDSLINLYIFGEKIGCNGLKNASMDELQDWLDNGDISLLKLSQISQIFENTLSTTDPIRRFCAAIISFDIMYTHSYPTSELHAFFLKVPDALRAYLDFTRDFEKVGIRAMGGDPRQRWEHAKFRQCYFHSHDLEEECDTTITYPRDDDDLDVDICYD